MALVLFWLDTLLCMAIKLKIELWVSLYINRSVLIESLNDCDIWFEDDLSC